LFVGEIVIKTKTTSVSLFFQESIPFFFDFFFFFLSSSPKPFYFLSKNSNPLIWKIGFHLLPKPSIITLWENPSSILLREKSTRVSYSAAPCGHSRESSDRDESAKNRFRFVFANSAVEIIFFFRFFISIVYCCIRWCLSDCIELRPK